LRGYSPYSGRGVYVSKVKITPRNILRHELLGMKVKAIEKKSGEEHIGEVVEETRNIIRIMLPSKRVLSLPKKTHLFEFTLPDGRRVLVEGETLIGRPEERLKRRIKRW